MWFYAFNQSFQKYYFLAISLKQNNFLNISILILHMQPNESLYKHEIKVCKSILISLKRKKSRSIGEFWKP